MPTFIDPDFCLQPTHTGPLDGLTFAVKDVFALQGHTASLGNPTWLATHTPATETAPIIAKILAAGATLRGITVTDEFMFSIKGNNIHYGAPANPKRPDCFAGGSSSGSASAVASGTVDFALGTDTGGSIGVPASYCGLYGIRPTWHADRLRGVAPLAPSFDTIGWLAQSPTVFAAVCRVLLAPGDWHPQETAALPQPATLERLRASFQRLQGSQAWHSYGAWLTRHHPTLGADIQAHFDAAREFAHAQLAADWVLKRDWTQTLNRQLTAAVLPLTPTGAPLPRTASTALGEQLRAQTQRLTSLSGLAGCPQVVVPTATGSRSVIGPRDSDLGLVAYALQ